MKKIIYIIITCCMIAATSFAQVPQGMNYQAIARNSSGTVLDSQRISIRFTITNGNAGDTLYQETNSVTTNKLGLFTLNVGNGTPVIATFASINWAANTPWLRVEMDPNGGTNYILMGTSQLLSVPYALYAASSGSIWTDYAEIDEQDTLPTLNVGNSSFISNTRLLNTLVSGAGSSITFNSFSHSIVLAPGKYYVTASAPIQNNGSYSYLSYLNFAGSVSNSIFSDYYAVAYSEAIHLVGIINVNSSETFLLNQYIKNLAGGGIADGGTIIDGVSPMTYARVLIQRIQ